MMTFVYNEEKRRYAAMDEGQEIGRLLFSKSGEKTLVFKHLIVEPEHRGKGVAGQLLKYAMEDVAKRGLKVVPVCPYVRKAFDENAEYRQNEAVAKKVGVIVGSLRKESFSRKVAEKMSDMLPEGYAGELVEIGQLPLYNQDFDDGNGPESYDAFRAKIASLDGLIFVTPEYNRGTSAVLKNAMDVASRPWGHNKWGGKPAMVVGVTPGALGAMAAVIDVRKTLAFLNVPVMGQPEAYLSNAGEMFKVDGSFASEEVKGFVQKLVDSYVKFAQKTLG